MNEKRSYIWLLLLPFLGACQPTIDLETKELLSEDAPVTVSQPKGPGETKSTNEAPDWDARREELVTEGLEKYPAPGEDDLVTVALKDREETREGKIIGVDDEKVTFLVQAPAGGEAEITLERTALAPVTMRAAYPEEAAEAYADMELEKEKDAWKAKQDALVASATSSNNRPPPPAIIPGQGAPEMHVPGTTVSEMPPPQRLKGPIVLETKRSSMKATQLPDGSMPQVTIWLKKNIANPTSIKIIRWGTLQPEARGKGKQLDVEFSSDAGGSFGIVTETKRFFMKDDGRIYEVANVK